MKKVFLLFLSLVLVFIFAGCSKKEVKSDQPATQETAQKAAPTETAKKDEPMMSKEQPKKVETVPVKEDVNLKTSMFGDILFDFDKYTVREDAKPTLKEVADWMVKNKDAKMTLEGYCDDRGTNEYNLALGEKRAKSARDYLVSAGVAKKKLDTISFGEEKPLCQEQTEDCWQKNRRVHFTSAGKVGD